MPALYRREHRPEHRRSTGLGAKAVGRSQNAQRHAQTDVEHTRKRQDGSFHVVKNSLNIVEIDTSLARNSPRTLGGRNKGQCMTIGTWDWAAGGGRLSLAQRWSLTIAALSTRL